MRSRQTSKMDQPAKIGTQSEVADAAPFDIKRWLQRKRATGRVPISLSADGKWLAVTMKGLVTDGGVNADSRRREGGVFDVVFEDAAGSEIWIVERSTGKIIQPFKKFAGSYGPVWSPDDASLAFEAQDAPTRYPRVAVWSPGDNMPRIYENAPCSRKVVGFSAPSWTPGARRIIFFQHDVGNPRATPIVHTILGESGHRAQSGEPAHLSETLAVLDTESGVVRSLPGPDVSRTWGFRLSPDGNVLHFSPMPNGSNRALSPIGYA